MCFSFSYHFAILYWVAHLNWNCFLLLFIIYCRLNKMLSSSFCKISWLLKLFSYSNKLLFQVVDKLHLDVHQVSQITFIKCLRCQQIISINVDQFSHGVVGKRLTSSSYKKHTRQRKLRYNGEMNGVERYLSAPMGTLTVEVFWYS